MSNPLQNLTVRVGCHLVYQVMVPTPVLFVLRPYADDKQTILQEKITYSPPLPADDFIDVHGNRTLRSMLQPGQNVIHHDALVAISDQPDNYDVKSEMVPIEFVPAWALRYTLPSRYCDSDNLMDFAWQQFGTFAPGLDRVYAICNWVHLNIAYRYGGGRPDISASQVVQQRYGVCRDFAHVAIALCRTFNMPARYVVGHLPDIGFQDPGTPMDFHAYFEVYLGHNWCTFDARFNTPRIGRVKVAQGLDAVDGAFSTTYGPSSLTHFEVWAYQIDPTRVTLDMPIDLSLRLDGTPTLRYF